MKYKKFLYKICIYLLLLGYIMMIVFILSTCVKTKLHMAGSTDTTLYYVINKVFLISGTYWVLTVVVSFFGFLYLIKKAEEKKEKGFLYE
ncbi:MAG: hypothetical protein ACOCRK_00845 [bacterium]